jgi:hypothetical protein
MRTAVHRHRRRQRLLQQKEEKEEKEVDANSGDDDRGESSSLRQVLAAGVGAASAVAGLVSALNALPD